MFRWWVRLLPYQLVVFLGRRNLETVRIDDGMEGMELFPNHILAWRKDTKSTDARYFEAKK